MARLHVVPSVGPYIIAAAKPTDHSRCHVLRWEMMLVRKIVWKHGPRLPGVTCSNQPRAQQSVALNVPVITKCTAICQRSWPQEARPSSTMQFLVIAWRNNLVTREETCCNRQELTYAILLAQRLTKCVPRTSSEKKQAFAKCCSKFASVLDRMLDKTCRLQSTGKAKLGTNRETK
jgi:hypothetical protein